MNPRGVNAASIPRFERDAVGHRPAIMRIGDGQIGGKARGLVDARDALREEFAPGQFSDMEVDVPTLTVVTTEVFEEFLDRNHLHGIAYSDEPDRRIAHAFQQGEMPPAFVGDLRALIEHDRMPLAVRSSSILEDALFRPFAGVYQTKMTPNNQPETDERARRLIEALKLVWASTFFGAPKRYIQTTDRSLEDEKMAVLIQEVVGRRHRDLFYPDVSGIARSYNFYPAPNTTHEEGIVHLGLGLGKLIVDGGITWFYPPSRPRTPPPFGSTRDQMKNTQTVFWGVNVGQPPPFNPVAETEFLVQSDLTRAEADGVLGHIASTYDSSSDCFRPSVVPRGPRVINFAPMLNENMFQFNDVLSQLMRASERLLHGAVEIEFALTLPHEHARKARLGFLQVRPMLVGDNDTVVTLEELERSDVVLASSRVIGNGTDQSISDVVYVRPECFSASCTRQIANDVARVNATLLAEGRPYVLIGFGRWGTTDPSAGVPVTWDQIAGAKVIVETTVPGMSFELSQGSHFFHNLISFHVCYLMISHADRPGVNWTWLDSQEAMTETDHVRHVRLQRPLLVMVDGGSHRGVIRWTS